jgi:hypothetical protein
MALEKLVSSPVYKKTISALKKKAKFKIARDPFFEPSFTKRLKAAGLKVKDLETVLTTEFDRFVDFSAGKMKQSDYDEQEYPKGEKPGKDDKDVIIEDLGYDPGFLIINMIEFILAKRGRKELELYFKAIRIPYASKYAKRIMGII